MRLAISNIAWDVDEDEQVAELLERYGIDAIDIAPSKYFEKLETISDRAIARVRKEWAARGIEITGMQSLLYGTTGLNMFGSRQSRQSMLAHLAAVCRIGAGLGATRLVFGSPKNRDRHSLDDQQTQDIACEFFSGLGDIAQQAGVLICLEPNPPRYGANFMMTSAQTAAVVRDVAHPAIRMHLDLGALTLNGEEIEQVLRADGALIAHIHLSEPDLLALGDGTVRHDRAAKALAGFVPDLVASIEMLAAGNEPHTAAIERSLRTAVEHYRSPRTGVNV
jgi:D-psicose/D-tagatose/L-ribulose 3-epimerase